MSIGVLIVEDNRMTRTTLMTFVRQMGYIVYEAKNGREAFDIWNSEDIRIVITDWNMPEINGIEFVKKLRENEGDLYTYVIMVTSRDESVDLIQGFEAGVDDYLRKPVHKQELTLRIRAGERVLSLQDKEMIIFALAKLAETRDNETGLHLERMQKYSKILAEELYKKHGSEFGITRNFIKNIYMTSPLHDIGKVGIKDEILMKPGKYTPEEYAMMKKHTDLGYETLMSVYKKSTRGEYLKMAADIAKSHHERWDGMGYPEGLSGQQIPLSARIVALADFYDALISKRVYKDAFEHQNVKNLILESSGKHFDPLIVELFLETEKQFQEIGKMQ